MHSASSAVLVGADTSNEKNENLSLGTSEKLESVLYCRGDKVTVSLPPEVLIEASLKS